MSTFINFRDNFPLRILNFHNNSGDIIPTADSDISSKFIPSDISNSKFVVSNRIRSPLITIFDPNYKCAIFSSTDHKIAPRNSPDPSFMFFQRLTTEFFIFKGPDFDQSISPGGRKLDVVVFRVQKSINDRTPRNRQNSIVVSKYRSSLPNVFSYKIQ